MAQQGIDFVNDSLPLKNRRLFLKRLVSKKNGKRVEAKQIVERTDLASLLAEQREQFAEIVGERVGDAAIGTPRLEGLLDRLLRVESKKSRRRTPPDPSCRSEHGRPFGPFRGEHVRVLGQDRS
jgi:hypothetical protein